MAEKINKNIVAVFAFFTLFTLATAYGSVKINEHYSDIRDKQVKLELQLDVLSRFDAIISKLDSLNGIKSGKNVRGL